MTKSKKIVKNKMELIKCNHCHKMITSPALAGLTLICPYCKKSVNGQYYHKLTDKELSEIRKK